VEVPYLWVKCTTSAECKTYLNSRVHGIRRVTVWSQSQCLGLGWFTRRELISGKVYGCVPGLLWTGSPIVLNWFSEKQLSYLGYNNCLQKPF
jgi:hypothetical protein